MCMCVCVYIYIYIHIHIYEVRLGSVRECARMDVRGLACVCDFAEARRRACSLSIATDGIGTPDPNPINLVN